MTYTTEEVEVKIRMNLERLRRIYREKEEILNKYEISKTALAELFGVQVTLVQMKPYTMVIMLAKVDDTWYQSTSFAKANLWRDEYDEDFGENLCIHRCIKNIAEHVVNGTMAEDVRMLIDRPVNADWVNVHVTNVTP